MSDNEAPVTDAADDTADTEKDNEAAPSPEQTPTSPFLEGVVPDQTANAPTPPMAAQGEAPAEAEEPAQPEAPASEKPVPAANEIIVTGERPKVTAQDLHNDDMAIAQALTQGKITPKTYGQLADESTFGKIGTLFGLLMSGFGSGLSGQQNALLGMMDKTIDRDLAAQRGTQENAQNWFRLSQQYQLQKAQIPQLQAQADLLREQVKTEPTKRSELSKRIEALDAEIKERTEQSKFVASNTAKNAMSLAMLHRLQTEIVDPMPDGPQKQAAMQTIQNTAAQIDAANSKRNQDTEGALNARDALKRSVPNENGVNIQKLNKLRALGAMETQYGGTAINGMSPEQYSIADREAKEVQGNRAIAKAYDDSFHRIKEASLVKRLDKNFMAAEQQAVNTVVAKQLANRYVTAEAAAQANALFPSLSDMGTGADVEKYRKAMETFRNNESDKTVLDTYKLRSPFPFSGEYKTRDTVKLQAPDGSIQVKPRSEAEKWIKKGAKVVP